MTERLRVAVYYNAGFGGGRRWLYEVSSRLSAYHDVDFYCINRPSLGSQFPDGTDIAARSTFRTLRDLPRVPGKLGKALNLPASWIDFLRFNRVARSLAREIDAKAYDLVFVCIGDYTYAPMILRHLHSNTMYFCHEPMRTVYEPEVPRPYLRTRGANASRAGRLWRWIDSDYAGLRKAWDAQGARNAKHLLANSKYGADYAQRAYGVPARVNYPGVDSNAFRPGDAPRERFVLAGPGAVVRSKGYDWAIRAIGAIPADRRPKLVIVGNSAFEQERAYLEGLAATLHVEADIRVGVADTELKRLLQTAAVMLYTPHLEPFGLAAVEAMASGTPVVAVREAGPAETVIDGVTGFLRDRDAQQLGDAVLRLLEDDELRERMGRAARDEMVQHWTWEQSVRELDQLLGEMVKSERASDGATLPSRDHKTRGLIATRRDT